MLHTSKTGTWLAIALTAFIGITAIAWQNNPGSNRKYQQDTLPKNHAAKDNKTVIDGDIDKAIEEVNSAQENLQKQLENKDWQKIHRSMEQSLANIDAVKIQEQLTKAMKQMDWEKIQLQSQEALRKIDWQKMQAGIQKAQDAINPNGTEKMQQHIAAAMESAKKAMENMKTVDMEKMQHQLELARESLQLNEGRLREELEIASNDIKKNLKKDFRKELEKAKQGVAGATATLQNYKLMLTEMDKDGLLKTDAPYHIEYNKGVLLINGIQQPDSVLNKYKHYFKKEQVIIKKEKDDAGSRTIDL